jgi:hypothetical protein
VGSAFGRNGSRHIDIKVTVGERNFEDGHVRGTGIAAHFTKCLPTIKGKALEYMDVLGFLSFEGMLLGCLFDFEIRNNSFSGILFVVSTRNRMFCGGLCEEPSYSNQETVVLPPFEPSFARTVNGLLQCVQPFSEVSSPQRWLDGSLLSVKNQGRPMVTRSWNTHRPKVLKQHQKLQML